MAGDVDVDELKALGRAEGLDAVGIAPADPLRRARTALEERKAAGLHAGMAFTYKNPARSTTPAGLVRDARAIVVGARRYATDPPPPATSGPQGRVARYAWADRYAPLRDALWTMARVLRRAGWRAVVFADDNSLVDREAAYLAGLGWYGKNANLLLPGQGSWFVLGSVVTDAPLPPERSPMADGCGSCRRCLDGCPTGAIIAPGVVDANRCLAWLVQRPGPFPAEHRAALHDRIYGCDDCQEVCPPNRRLGPATSQRHDRAWRPARPGQVRLSRPGSTCSGSSPPTTPRCWPAMVAGTSPTGTRAGCGATPSWRWATSVMEATSGWLPRCAPTSAIPTRSCGPTPPGPRASRAARPASRWWPTIPIPQVRAELAVAPRA